MESLSDRIRKLIDSKGVTPYEVSKETGVPESSLSRILTKGANPNRKNRNKLAEYFNVSPEYLLTGKEEIIKLAKDNITLDDDLVNRKEEFRAIVFYLNENMDKLMGDEVFKMFMDKIKAECRAEVRIELAKEREAEMKKDKDIIRGKLSEEKTSK